MDTSVDDLWAALPDAPDDDTDPPDPEPVAAEGTTDDESGDPEDPAVKWLKIGVELEGGWDAWQDTVDRKAQRRGTRLKGDGSVQVTANTRGEIASRPYKRLPALMRFMDDLYPDHVNHTCGMHVHASFNLVDYGTLMTPHFYFYFLLRWQSWGQRLNIRSTEFWSRLKGENNYCLRAFTPYGQLDERASRYGQLNYCLNKHGTIECRLLPMFKDKEISKKAVIELLSIYNDYLEQYGQETDLEHTVQEPQDSEQSESWSFEVVDEDLVEKDTYAFESTTDLSFLEKPPAGTIRLVTMPGRPLQVRDRVAQFIRQNSIIESLIESSSTPQEV